MEKKYRHIIEDLLERDGEQLTPDQAEALEQFYDFHADGSRRTAFLLRGAAGTGKTFLIRLITRFLMRQGYKVALLAPTGRAAKVITRRTARYASTIHRYIYSPVESPGGSVFFDLKENKDPERTYYILDEASMIGDGGDKGDGGTGLLNDFLRFAYNEYEGRKIIMVGDPAQLPPVGSQTSPALDAKYMHEKCALTVYRSDMTAVMRQAAHSEVLRVANVIRESMERGAAPVIDIAYGGEVELMDNGYEALELYTGLYREDDPDAILFLTYSNKMAVEINTALRHQLFEAEEPLIAGELLMVVR
ncbi:MAG TPA: ATP-dependent endonuclease, partial [Bacteroidetes bacterium]|nr:ATP-dependent endonuclease [Bacteroidota bacterium]